jgi:hypothetical protein
MQELILMLDQKLEWHLPKLLQHKSLYWQWFTYD